MLATTEGSGQGDPAHVGRRVALATFVILFMMNGLDYLDRNILNAILPQVKEALDLSNEQAGKLTTCFLVSFSVFSLVTGWLGDRVKRTRLLAFGVGVWTLATFACGLSRTYEQFWWARCFLGFGEGAYGVLAPTMLMDLFSREKRSRVMSFFYLAMPVGSALGVAIAAPIVKASSWHTVFFLVGLPGIFATLGALFLPEPVRGASEGVDPSRVRQHEKAGASADDYRDLLVNSSYTYTVFAMAMYTFVIGGLIVWGPYFLSETRGLDQTRANLFLGATALGASLSGMSFGGWLSDRLAKTNPRALMIVPGVAMLLAAPCLVMAFYARTAPWIFGALFFAEALMFMNTGPCNAVIANVIMPQMRATAYAVTLFAVHFLGDIWSPWLIGWMADYFGKADTMATPFGRFFAAIGANPVLSPRTGHLENLLAGMLIVIPPLILSGVVLLIGSRHLPREMALMLARLRAVPAGTDRETADVPPAD